MGFLSGCRIQNAITLVNTLTFNTGDFERLRLDYDADDIHVLKSTNEKLIVKEYMNENKQSFYARTYKRKGELLITEGDRPKRSTDNTMSAIIGTSPDITIELETRNGDINVSRRLYEK